jgi:Ca2+/H+ antiporter
MKKRRPMLFTAVMLMLAVGSYFRISGNENIRAVQFLSIFVIGMLSGVLIRELFAVAKSPDK